jgi:hypothetical protein
MQDRFPWLAVLEPLAKLTAAASMFAWLLHRARLRPAAVTTVTLAHVIVLFCLMPVPAELVFAAIIVLGTCSYAVLAVDRPWLRAGVVIACFIIIGALLAQASAAGTVAAVTTLALWTGVMVSIRDWARTRPKPRRPAAACGESS